MPETTVESSMDGENPPTTDPKSTVYPVNDEEMDGKQEVEAKPEVKSGKKVKEAKEPKEPKPMGRPRADGMTQGTVEAVQASWAIPKPRFRMYSNSGLGKDQTDTAFFRYWNDLQPWAKDRLVCYVYRDYPLLIPKTGEKEYAYIDKVGDPFVNSDDLLHKYGCGSYRLILTEAGKPSTCTCTFSGIGGADLRSNPPTDQRIDNISEVDLDHPSNKSYVAFLRSQGKLPEQSKKAEAEADMANIEIVRDALNQNAKLTDKLIEQSANNRGKETSSDDNVVEVIMDGAKKSNEMMREAYTQSREMMNETLDQIKEMQTGNNNDPAKLLELGLTLAEKFNRQPDASNNPALMEEIRSLRDRVSQMQDDRIKALEARITEAATRPASNTQFSSVKEGVSALREMREVVEEFSGGGGKESNPVTDAADDLGAPKWIRPLISYGLPLIGQIAQAFFASKGMGGGMGGPMPTMQPGQGMGIGPNGQPMPFPGAQPNPNFNPNPAAHSAPGPVLVPSAQIPGMPEPIAQIMSKIDNTLVSYILNPKVNGGNFADWFEMGFGQETFDAVRGLGVTQLVQIIYTYPTTAQALAQVPQLKVQEFVKEFCEAEFTYDESGEGVGGGEGAEVTVGDGKDAGKDGVTV